MTQRTKLIFCGIFALLVLGIGWGVFQRQRPAIAKYRLKRMLSKVEPWTASTNYSVAGWKQLTATAKAFQDAKPALAGEALGEYLQGFARDPARLPAEQAKLFLLLRVVFDLPESGGGQPRSFGGPASNGSDVSSDGSFNLAWPLAWNQGGPRLIAGCEHAATGTYDAPSEFSYLRYHFRLRDLAKVQINVQGNR